MVRYEKEREVNIVGFNGKTTKYILPEGIRGVDIKHITSDEDMVLCYIKEKGRVHRNFFVKHGLQESAMRLKRKGFIEAIRMGKTYYYDFTHAGRILFENHVI